MEMTFCVLRSVKIVHQQTLLTLGAHHAQQRQIAQVLNSEQPHLDQNNVRLMMDGNDRIGMWQKDHTAQSPSACQTPFEWARHIVVFRTRQARTSGFSSVIDQVPVERVTQRLRSKALHAHPTGKLRFEKARPTAFDVLRFAILSRRDAFRPTNGGLSILSRSDQVCSVQQTRGRHASSHDSKTSHPARRLSSTLTMTGCEKYRCIPALCTNIRLRNIDHTAYLKTARPTF